MCAITANRKDIELCIVLNDLYVFSAVKEVIPQTDAIQPSTDAYDVK